MIITKRFSSSSSLPSFFSGIYWRAISYFWDFSSSVPARKEIRNNLFRKILEEREESEVILTMGMLIFPVKCFHDEIELRVKLNLPSGHSQRVYSLFRLSLMKTPSHVVFLRCLAISHSHRVLNSHNFPAKP